MTTIGTFYPHSAASTNTGTLPTADQSTVGSLFVGQFRLSMDDIVGTTQVSRAQTTQANTTVQAGMFTSHLSGPIAAQTIAAQSITFEFAGAETNGVSNFQGTICLSVWRPSTGTLVGRLYDGPADTAWMTEFNTTQVGRSLSVTTTAVTAQNGDILVLELWRAPTAQTMATQYTNTIYYDGTTSLSATSEAASLAFTTPITMYAGGPQTLSATASDSLTTTDVANPSGTRSRAAADSLTTSDSVTGVKASAPITRTAADSITTTDAVALGAGTRARSAADSLTTSDTVARIAGHPRTAADSLTTSDTAAAKSTHARAASDSLTTSDTVTGVKGIARSAADSLTTTDVVTGVARSHYDNLVLSDGAVLYMPLDDPTNPVDIAGSHTVTNSGDLTLTTGPGGIKASVFNGSTSYVAVADADDLSPSTTNALTVEMLIRPDNLTPPHVEGTGYVHFAGKGAPGQSEYVSRMYSSTNTETPPRVNRISAYAFNPVGGTGVGSYWEGGIKSTDGGTPAYLAAGDWVYYVMTIQITGVGTGTIQLFRNGVKMDHDDLGALSITPVNGTDPFRVGTRDFSSWFPGAIAKVAIYPTVLTPTQVATHARALLGGVNFNGGLADTFTTSDTVGAKTTHSRAAADSLTTSDTAAGNSALARTTADSLTTSDSVTGVKGIARAASDTITTTDSATGIKGVGRSASDSLTTTDTAARSALSLSRGAADSLTTSDTAARTSGRTRTVSDSLTTSDTASRGVSAHPRTAADSLTTSDVAVAKTTHARTSADSLTTSDTVARVAAHKVTATDSLTTSDSVAIHSTRTRSTADSMTISDQADGAIAGGAQHLSRSASDSLTTTDVATRGAGTRTRTAADSITTTDTVARSVGRARPAADSITTSDAVTRASAKTRTAADSITIGDAGTAKVSRHVTTSDSITITDVAGRNAAHPRGASDTITFTITAAGKSTQSRAPSDSLAISDSTGGTADHVRGAVDSLAISDLMSQVLVVGRDAGDSLAVSDVADISVGYVRVAGDALTVTDSIQTYQPHRYTVLDTVSLPDAATGIARRSLSHVWGIRI